MTADPMRTVQLPEDLCSAAEQTFRARFETVDSLLEFLLRELFRDDAVALDRAEQNMIDQRLRELGYL